MKFRSQLCQTGIKKLVESGKGFPFDPGTGKPMKDRVLIPQSKKIIGFRYVKNLNFIP